MLARRLDRVLGRRRPRRSAPAAPDPAPDLACRAPFTSLHVDQFGDARPCCQSSRVLGNVATQSLDEIWTSDGLGELRDAMRRGDLSLGCEHCEWAGRHGRESTYAVRFDHDRLPEAGAGPTRLELAPSNACNLQCAMCNGDWSSAIRLHREGRPALERRFGPDQLAQVEALAPELDEIHLFGGEPLLMPEALRLLEIAAEHDVRCVITTNGSVFTPRVARLIDRPGVDLVVSVDGTSPEVYEAIRCGADWATLEDHLDSFAEIARRHGNGVDLAHCLMTANWHEFPDHLRWAAGRDLGVYVNDVLSPEELSLHHLSPPELRSVVDALEARDAEVRPLGGSWVAIWERTLDQLRQTLADGTSGARHPHLGELSATRSDLAAERRDAPTQALASVLRSTETEVAVVELLLDRQLRVQGGTTHQAAAGIGLRPLDELVGTASVDLPTLLAGEHRRDARTVLRWDADEACEERRYRAGSDASAIVERRSLLPGDDGVVLRFEYRREPSEQEKFAAIAALGDGEVVELVIDRDGRIAAIDPVDVAQRFGLTTELGGLSRTPADALAPHRADPPPDVDLLEIEPGLVAVELRWPDQQLVALASVGEGGVRVRIVSLAPTASGATS